MEMMIGAVRRRLVMPCFFIGMRHPRSGLSSPSNQYLKKLVEASWQQQLHGVCPRDVGEGVGGRREQDQRLAVAPTQEVPRNIQC